MMSSSPSNPSVDAAPLQSKAQPGLTKPSKQNVNGWRWKEPLQGRRRIPARSADNVFVPQQQSDHFGQNLSRHDEAQSRSSHISQDLSLLDSAYKVRDHPHKFFQFGKVFYVLWSEPAGSGNHGEPGKDMWTVAYGERVHTKVRRFVVVRPGTRSCVCLAISTHAGMGLSHPGVEAQEHAIIYTGREIPSLQAHELLATGEMPTFLPAIRVDPDIPSQQLDPTSRIDFGKAYTIRHDVKVKPFGVVNRISMAALKDSFLGSMSLQSSWVEILIFDGMDDRHATIRPALVGSCEWIFRRQEYNHWLHPDHRESHGGLLWLKGKPGSGKSTLMKHLVIHLQNQNKDDIVASFFFNGRGEILQRSVEGMFRTLLYQIFCHMPRITRHLSQHARSITNRTWPLQVLMNIFREVVTSLDTGERLICIIDGLDECEEHEIRQVVDFFEDLSESATFHNKQFLLCYSSRHYPNISTRAHEEIILDAQPEHMHDISSYVAGKLPRGLAAEAAQKLRSQIIERSSGIFLWAVLVVQRLNAAFDRGIRTSDLFRVLENEPHGLADLWKSPLNNMSDLEARDFEATLRWVSQAKRVLSLQELFFAVNVSTGQLDTGQWDHTELDIDAMRRFILHTTRGLLECYTSDQGVDHVGFIHESARIYTMTNGIVSNDSAPLKIAEDCLRYLQLVLLDTLRYVECSHDSLFMVSGLKLSTQEIPLMEYAMRYGLGHLEDAFSRGSEDLRVLEALTLRVLDVSNFLIHPQVQLKLTHSASPLYLLVLEGYPALIKAWLTGTSDSPAGCMPKPDLTTFCGGWFGSPLHAAASLGNKKVVQLLLAHGAAVNLRGRAIGCELEYPSPLEAAILGRDMMGMKTLNDELPPPFNTVGQAKARKERADVEAKYSASPEQPHIATDSKNRPVVDHRLNRDSSDTAQIVEILLNYGADINHVGALSALHTASYFHSSNIIRLLLGHGADVNAANKIGQTALHVCVSQDHSSSEETAIPVVDVLLQAGIDPDVRDHETRTALMLACAAGWPIVAQMLLRRGADVNSLDRTGNTPLMLACSQGTPETVRTLLEFGANPNWRNEQDATALQLACSVDRPETLAIVRHLLQHGTDPNARDRCGHTPLSVASNAGRHDLLEILLEYGAEPNVVLERVAA
jgi:ankyrin repeat protein